MDTYLILDMSMALILDVANVTIVSHSSQIELLLFSFCWKKKSSVLNSAALFGCCWQTRPIAVYV